MKEKSPERSLSQIFHRNPFKTVLNKIKEDPNCRVEETTLEKSGIFTSGWLDDEDPKD